MATAHTLCAVLIAGSPADDSAQSPLPEETPLHLTPLLGKTPLVFAVQTLVDIGVTRIVCIGWDEPQLCQAQLQTGQQWGCDIEWHSIAGPEQAFSRLAELAPAEGPFVLATTCTLMRPPLMKAMESGTLFEPAMSSFTAGPNAMWNWAWLDRGLSQLLGDQHAWRDWPRALASVCTERLSVQALNLMDGSAILAAIAVMLKHEFPVVLEASEVEPGIFLSRNVVIHPTAEILAPFYAGPNVEIEKYCRIGPDVAISKRTRIGQSCHISHTQLGPDTWIGEFLDIHESVVSRGIIWSGKHQARMTIFDAVILAHGAANWQWSKTMASVLERALALLLWLVMLPVWLPMSLWSWWFSSTQKQMALVRPDISHMAIPTVNYTCWMNAYPGTRGWRHLVGFVLPNLWSVLAGRCLLMGTRPRSPEEWALLPISHQRWLATQPSGLVQEEWLLGVQENDPLQSMVMERYQEVRAQSAIYKLGLISRYLRECLLQPRPVMNQARKTLNDRVEPSPP